MSTLDTLTITVTGTHIVEYGKYGVTRTPFTPIVRQTYSGCGDDRPIMIDTNPPVRHTQATWGKAALLFLTLAVLLAAIAWVLA